MPEYTDNSYMPFGKFKGYKMANVPGSYLIWLHGTGINETLYPELKKYIEDNMDVLKKEQYITKNSKQHGV